MNPEDFNSLSTQAQVDNLQQLARVALAEHDRVEGIPVECLEAHHAAAALFEIRQLHDGRQSLRPQRLLERFRRDVGLGAIERDSNR